MADPSVAQIIYQPCSIIEQPPEPAAPCQEMLPWEKYEQEQRLEEAKRNEKLREAQERSYIEAQKGGIDSIIAKASETATKISTGIGEGVEKMEQGIRETLYQAQRSRFVKDIGIIKPEVQAEPEILWFEYTCKVLNGNIPVPGLLYVSTNFISFYHELGNEILRFVLPLESIVAIHHAVTLELKNSEHPFLQQVLNQNVKFNSLLIYTNDQKVHSFFGFGVLHDPLADYTEHAWNVIDHAWRKAKNINNA